MKKIINFIKKRLPSPELKIIADRLFLISIVSLSLGGWVFGTEEGFICLLSALVCYLSNLTFHRKKSVLSRGVQLFLLSLISVLLGTVNATYIPIISPLYTFFLVLFEKDEYHRGVPIFYLPLAIHLMSIGIPLELIFQRVGSVFLGIAVALTAKAWIWPSQGKKETTSKKEHIFSPLRIKYALRKSIGIALIFIAGKVVGVEERIIVWGAYLFLIFHSPIDTDIFPKVSKRIGGTILGGLLYLPLRYFVGSKIIIYILSFAALYLVFIFIGQCYVTAVTFITLNILLSSVGAVTLESVLGQRFIFTILGGGMAIVVSLLIPLKEELSTHQVK